MNKIMDYMFFGCPIVAFDLKENRVSAQDAAVYVTPNPEDEMADKVERLLANENRSASSERLWEGKSIDV